MRRSSMLLIAVAAAFVLSYRLGARGLNEPDEGRCAGIAHEMLESGDWITPRLYGLAHFNKPPLVYWCTATFYRAGGVNEWTARATAAFAAFGMLLLTCSIARRLFNETAAVATGLVLLSSPLFTGMARVIDPNMLLAFCVTLAMWGAISWFHEDRRRYLVVFYLGLALSFLAKGPVGMAIVGLALLGYRIGKRPDWPWSNLWSTPLALACVAASLSWFVAVGLKHRELFDFFIRHELVNRLFTDEHHRAKPLFFYLFMVPAAVAPWLPFVVRGAARPLAQYRTDAPTRLLASWVALPLLMFSISSSKMPAYILPLLPPLAIFAGASLAQRAKGIRAALCWLPAVLIAIAMPIALLIHGHRDLQWTFEFGVADAVGVVLFVAAAAGVLVASDPLRRAWATAAMLILSYMAAERLILRNETKLDAHTTTREVSQVLERHLLPEDRLVLYDRHPRGLSFYLDHPVTVPSFKFEIQLPADFEQQRDFLYDDSQDVMDWFDSTQRVFAVVNERGEADIRNRCTTPAYEVYRDSKYIVLCNRPLGHD